MESESKSGRIDCFGAEAVRIIGGGAGYALGQFKVRVLVKSIGLAVDLSPRSEAFD